MGITGRTFSEYVRPEFGLMQMSTALADAYAAARAAQGLGAGLHTNRRLIKLRRAPAADAVFQPLDDHRYALTFEVSEFNPCTGYDVPTGITETVFAKRVVLALPRAALQDLAAPDDGVLFGATGDNLGSAFSSVGFVDALKMFPVWEAPTAANWLNTAMHSTAGRHLTSEYAAQVFSWYPGTASLQPLATCPTMTATQLYVIGAQRQSFWSTIYGAVHEELVNCSHVRGGGGQSAAEIEAACMACASPSLRDNHIGPISDRTPSLLVNAVRAQLADVTGMPYDSIPVPSRIHYRVWDRNSALRAHGVHNWLAGGARWWEVSERMLQPNPQEDVHIVGESFSSPTGQGWISGALETAERMLVLKLGLPRLAGLTREDICAMNPFSDDQPKA